MVVLQLSPPNRFSASEIVKEIAARHNLLAYMPLLLGGESLFGKMPEGLYVLEIMIPISLVRGKNMSIRPDGCLGIKTPGGNYQQFPVLLEIGKS